MIKVEGLTVKYDKKTIINNMSLEIEKSKITTIVGPNGCGKSTLFKAMTKTKKIAEGKIYYDEDDIFKMSSKVFAKKVAILPQNPIIPMDITVRELVEYGRYPHLGWTNRLKNRDLEVINWAMDKTRISHLKNRKISTMSGGERQRAFIAMALSQEPKILFLDEPTTYLDICHQFEILELIKELNQDTDITVIMILHDLNQASRYSEKMIVMNKGGIYKSGVPEEIMNEETLRRVFKLEVDIIERESRYFIPINSVK